MHLPTPQSVCTPEAPGFARRQANFAAHIRDPQCEPAPADVPERRMALYRELFFNNVEGLLAAAFPVLHSISDAGYWQALVRDFYRNHQARTPLFHELPAEFVHYLQQERIARADDPAFLAELAHYEWVELALVTAEDPPARAAAGPAPDPLTATPRLSPLAWSLTYRWPVQHIAPDALPDYPQTVHLLVYRDAGDAVRFIELNPTTARLLELAETGTLSGLELLLQIARELNAPSPRLIVEGGGAILQDLYARGVLLTPGGDAE